MFRKEELKNAKSVFQNGTPKEKWEFIWDYYKWPLIILAFILALVVCFIYANVTAKDCVLGGIFLNSTSTEEAIELEQGFIDYSSINTKKEEVYFATNHFFSNDAGSHTASMSYETLQIISVKISAGEIDFMVDDVATMNDFAYWQYFYDLSEVLPEEKMEKYAPYFLYYDRAIVKDLNNIQTSDELLAPIVYPNPYKPELMEDPVPVFIDVSACEKLQSLYPRLEDGYVIAFAVNGKNGLHAIEFLDYIFDDNDFSPVT